MKIANIRRLLLLSFPFSINNHSFSDSVLSIDSACAGQLRKAAIRRMVQQSGSSGMGLSR